MEVITGSENISLDVLCRNKAELMFNLFLSLQKNLEFSSSQTIVDLSIKLGELQKEIEVIEQGLDKRVVDGGPLSPEENQAIADKKHFQKQTLELHNQLIPKINNVKSTLASEMVALKTGRKAISRYGNQVKNRGKIINRSG